MFTHMHTESAHAHENIYLFSYFGAGDTAHRVVLHFLDLRHRKLVLHVRRFRNAVVYSEHVSEPTKHRCRCVLVNDLNSERRRT